MQIQAVDVETRPLPPAPLCGEPA